MIKKILLVLLILFASYSDIFLFRMGIVPVQPSKSLIPLFLGLFFITYSPKSYLDIFNSHTFKFVFFILVLKIIYSIPSKAESAIITEEIVRQVMTILIYLAALHTLRTSTKKEVRLFFIACIVLLAGSVWYDFFIGLPKYNLDLAQSLRKGGFGENPNQSASGIKFLGLGLLFLLNKNILARNILIFFIVSSVFLTFSRSGIVSIAFILVLGTFNSWGTELKIDPIKQSKNIFKIIILFTVLYGGLLVFADIIRSEVPAFTRGAAGERMDLLLGQSDQVIMESNDDSELSRVGLFKKYLNDFFDNPLGHGTGYSADRAFNQLKTHNYYLYFAVNFGILALFAYLFYLIKNLSMAFRSKEFYYLIFGLLLILEGLFSHSIMIERAILISIAFFDTIMYSKRTGEDHTNIVNYRNV